MAIVTYQGSQVVVQPEQTVLDALLQAGHDIPNSCRAGTCQSCLMQVVDGDIPAQGQKGLKPAQAAQNYFFPCRTFPEGDLEIVSNPALLSADGEVIAKEWLSESVLGLTIKSDLPYRAGQFVEIKRSDGLGRSYSIASVANEDNLLEFHIRVYEDGQFSSWLARDLKVNDVLTLVGPMGDCFYINENLDAPILLAGTGTGLAPLIGIATDALQQGHMGPIHLAIAARTEGSLYAGKQLLELSERYANFSFTQVVLEQQSEQEGIVYGDLNVFLKDKYPDLKGFKVFLCGSAQRVNKLRRDCFMRGASMRDISADAFIPKAS